MIRRGAVAALGVVAVLVLVGLVGCRSGPGSAPSVAASSAGASTDTETALRWAELADLPPEAARTVALIERGGPFPYAKDGAVFANRERVLPRRPSGYYREYTVPTPGSADRGARRIVTGDANRLFFYTGDHYATFVRVRR